MKNKFEEISLVLIDTSAFTRANSDFLGLNNSLLPSLFEAIKEKGIKLLSHPILDKEIQKHIEDSSIYKEYQSLVKNLNKCDRVLKLAGCYDEELIKKISEFDIKKKTIDTYEKIYKESIVLSYPDPEKIFEQYFASNAPFSSTGNKKAEFPDAFILQSVKEYMENNYCENLLVISSDSDWKNAMCDEERVVFVDSISKALVTINGIKCVISDETIDIIFKAAYDDMIAEATGYAEWECYDIEEYEFSDDLEIEDVKVIEISDIITPLKITRDSLFFKTTAIIEASGHGIFFDEDNSIWDREDEIYLYKTYSEITFEKAYAEVECEIQIEYDISDPQGSPQVKKFKFNNRFCINLEPSDPEFNIVESYEEDRDLLEDLC